MTDPTALVLVFDSRLRAELESLVQTLPWSTTRDVQFRDSGPDPVAAVSALRATNERVPIGVLSPDEATVLGALSAGADEAAVMLEPDPTLLTSFVDRLAVRARHRAEQSALHESLSHAERLTALGTLVASVGHEINNPLTALSLSMDVARRMLAPILEKNVDLSHTATSLFDDVASATESIATIVRDLRVLSRGDVDELVELVEVPALVDQALRLVARELSHAIIERDYAADLPRLVVPRNRVAQVIVNLLVNAAHATRDMPRPVHRVRVSVRADDEFVAITVSDTGPGIEHDHLGRIFTPFFTTKRERGTGLGLSISRSILRGLGGELSLDSVYGDGATFLCLLPLPSHESVVLASRRAEILPSRAPRESRSVLVVEDDPRLLRSYARVLHPTHRVLTAEDTAEAIEALESGLVPDVVVLELDLSDHSGLALLEALASHPERLDRRVLLVTSAASREEYAEFLRTYDGPVLRKPVRGEQLLSAMDLVPWEPSQ